MSNLIKVFISYGREDENAAKRLYSDLKKAGLDPWFDKESLLPGQKWIIAIRQAIKESRYFLALLSKTSVEKRGVIQYEFKDGLSVLEEFPENDIYFIPVRLDDCTPTYQMLSDLQWVDMFPNWDEGFRRLLHSISPKVYIRKKIPMRKVYVVVSDFRNFSLSASEYFVGQRYSEYILQELLKNLDSSIQIQGSVKMEEWLKLRQPSKNPKYDKHRSETSYNPFPRSAFNLGITEIGKEKLGSYFEELEKKGIDTNLILRDKIGVYIEPERNAPFDLRKIMIKSEFSSQYSGCCVVTGSIGDGEKSDYMALVRMVWISVTDERTWFITERSFNKEDMVEDAIGLSKAISESLYSHIEGNEG